LLYFIDMTIVHVCDSLDSQTQTRCSGISCEPRPNRRVNAHRADDRRRRRAPRTAWAEGGGPSLSHHWRRS
jgi:hypothetical protein